MIYIGPPFGHIGKHSQMIGSTVVIIIQERPIYDHNSHIRRILKAASYFLCSLFTPRTRQQRHSFAVITTNEVVFCTASSIKESMFTNHKQLSKLLSLQHVHVILAHPMYISISSDIEHNTDGMVPFN